MNPPGSGVYSTCLFCSSSLGKNETIEAFPVGRKLAFDAEKGRLWVVCAACGRWNLTPLEERWEAIEACERSFRATRLRTSTENIGLARLGDGTELVRVGRPLRPEFAAWRYGVVMQRRARRALWGLGAAGAVGASAVGLVLAGPAALVAGVPLAVSALGAALYSARKTADAYASRRAERGLRDNAGERILQPGHQVARARLRQGRDLPGGWALEVRTGMWEQLRETSASGVEYAAGLGFTHVRTHVLTGSPAERAVSVMLARANADGATGRQVQGAVRLIERAGSPERWFGAAENEARRRGWGYQDLWYMPLGVRLALEMASHEEAERRAMEGELAVLEAAWRDAEELAAISDALLTPASVEHQLSSLRDGSGPPHRPVASAPGSVPEIRPPAAPASPATGLRQAREAYARRMAERRSRADGAHRRDRKM